MQGRRHVHKRRLGIAGFSHHSDAGFCERHVVLADVTCHSQRRDPTLPCEEPFHALTVIDLGQDSWELT